MATSYAQFAGIPQAQPQSVIEEPKKRKGFGGFLTSLISEGGAIGGGVKGAALGSFAGPLGTLAGGAVGAGLGGFLGRLAENKIRDDEFKVGEAAKEGAVSAVFGASPIRAAKGIGAATKAAVQGAGKQGAKEAAEIAVTKPGILSKVIGGTKGKLGQSAERLETRASGLGVGEKLAGEKLTPQESKRLLKVAIDEGMPMGHPDTKAAFVRDKLTSLGKEIEGGITKSNRAITAKERNSILNGLSDRFESNVTLKNSPAAIREYTQLQTSLADIKDFKGLYKAKRDLQSRINFNRNSATPDPIKEVIYDNAQKTINELISGLNPTVKALNKRYGDLSKVEEGILNAASKLSNTSEAGGGGILGQIIRGDTAQSGKSIVGRAGRAATGTGKGVTDQAVREAFALEVPGQGAKGFASRILGGKAVTGGFNPDQEQVQQSDFIDSSPSLSQEVTDLGVAQEPSEYDPFANENVRSSVQKILAQGGDMKDVGEFLSVAETMQKLSSGDKPKPLNASQQTRARAAENALQDIPLILKAIESGKLGGAKTLPGSGTQIGRRILGTEDLDAALFNIADNILRARSGAAAPEAEVKRFRDTFLPSATDSAKAKKSKLERAVRELQGYLNPAGAEDPVELLQSAGY